MIRSVHKLLLKGMASCMKAPCKVDLYSHKSPVKLACHLSMSEFQAARCQKDFPSLEGLA